MSKELKSRLRTTFLELIAINSPYPHEDEVKTYIHEWFKKLGVTTKEDAFGNIFVRLDGVGEPLLLNTHFDIPETTPDAKYAEEGDVIRATGENILGADPKSGLAVLLEFAKSLVESDQEHRSIELVFTRGEEVGLVGALNLDYSMLRAKEGFVLDQDGPVSEVVVKAPGYIRVDGTFMGKVVHPCEPQNGVNALAIAAEAFHTLGYGYLTDTITWNIGKISGGSARNSVPGSVTFEAELRGFDTEELHQKSEAIKKHFTTVAESYQGTYQGEHTLFFAGYTLDTSNPLFAQLQKVMKERGVTPNFLTTFGGSDANVFNANGIACAAIGSGYYEPHQYSEWINLAEMADIHDVIVRLVGDEARA